MNIKSLKQEPQNFFFSKHVLSIAAFCYITILSPAIDDFIEGKLTKKDMYKALSALVYASVGASLKLFDKDVYTPHGLPGRDLEQAINNITSNTVELIQSQITQPVQEITDAITFPLNKIKEEINNPLINTMTEVKIASIQLNTDVTNTIVMALEDTYFKTKLADSTTLNDNEKLKVLANTQTFITSYLVDNTNNHITFINGSLSLHAYIPHVKVLKYGQEVVLVPPVVVPTPIINNNFRPTIEQCNQLYHTVLTTNEYKDLIKCLDTFGINTKIDVAHLLSQIGHESAGLRYNKEIASGEDYEYREDLGNIYEGDGIKYKGSGFIQLTGRANFTSFSQYINDPKVIELGCDYVADVYPFSSAGWFWNHNQLSSYINDEGATLEQVSTLVNGANPANGLEDRQFYFSRCKDIFNIS